MQATVMPMLAIVSENIRTWPIIEAPGIIERIQLPMIPVHFDQATDKVCGGQWVQYV